jgi:uncharacterized protein
MRYKKDSIRPTYNIQGIPFAVKAEDITEEGYFKGIASPFGGEPDSHGDVIVKGAFNETIMQGGRNGTGIAMLYQHNPSEPVGTWPVLKETNEGLYCEGQLELELEEGRKCRTRLKKNLIKGLSIGYDIPRDVDGNWESDAVEIKEDSNGRYIRYLKKLILWEISLVTFPAAISARVTNIKSFQNCRTKRDYERTLRDSGLSKASAQHIVSLMNLRDSEVDRETNAKNYNELEYLLAEFEKRNAIRSDF